MGKLIDETGNAYGHLTVLKRADNIITPNGRSHVAWLCKCDCGNETIVRGSNLRKGYTKSCGCHQHDGRLINEIGHKYGRLTVIERIGSNQDKKALWKCKCDCGNEIITTGKNLRNGLVRSCGCLKSFKESEIALLLINNKIKFSREYSFSDLKDLQPLRFDFAIFNTQKKLIGLIEYNGEQHYLTKERGRYTIDQIEKIQQHDKMKEGYCKKHNIPLLILNRNNYSENLILNWIKNIIRESEVLIGQGVENELN